MKRVCVPLLTALLLTLAGCAATSRSGSDPASPRGRQHNQIGSEEIAEVQFRNTYELIRGLRPAWIDGRGSQSLSNTGAGQVVVYLDGARAGGAEILRQLPVLNIQAARFLGPTEAAARYGLNHTGGAILITTRKQ